MAAQKKPASRGGAARSGPGGTRPGPGAIRSGSGAARPRTASNAAGNGVASANQPTGTSAAKARPASAAAKPNSGSKVASPAASGPRGKVLGPFRTVGFVPLATFVLSLYALGASVYLTIAHYDTHVTLACSDKGIVNCAEVTTSAQSMVFGVLPVAVLGLAFYVFMTALNSPWVWRLQQTGSEQLRKILRYTRVGAIVTGMGFVLYLVYAELIQIRAICLWCTSVHVATFLIFALIVFYTSFSSPAQVPAKRG
jgi:uncharacterized membrane protein